MNSYTLKPTSVSNVTVVYKLSCS